MSDIEEETATPAEQETSPAPLAEVIPLPIDAGRAKYLHRLLDDALRAGLPPVWQGLVSAALSRHDGGDAGKLGAVAAAIEAARMATGEPEPLFAFSDPAELAQQLAPVVYPVQGFALAPGPPAIVLAFSFGGKSIILQDLLLSVSLGQRAWQQFQCTPGKVAHFDYEQGKVQTIDRYQRLCRGRGIPLQAIADGRIQIAPYPRGHLYTPGAEEAYKRALTGVSLAFIDTFNAASPGRDENDAQIAEGIYMMGRVSEATGCTIIFAHHMGKASLATGRDAQKDPRALARGSTAIVAAAGYVYAIAGSKGAPRQVVQAKGRGLGDPQVDDFYLELSTVDCRGEGGFYNPSNPTDPGGFRVAYKTPEQVQPREEPKAKGSSMARLSASVLHVLDVAGPSGLTTRALRIEARLFAKGRNEEIDEAADRLVRAGSAVRRKDGRGFRYHLLSHVPSMAPNPLLPDSEL